MIQTSVQMIKKLYKTYLLTGQESVSDGIKIARENDPGAGTVNADENVRGNEKKKGKGTEKGLGKSERGRETKRGEKETDTKLTEEEKEVVDIRVILSIIKFPFKLLGV